MESTPPNTRDLFVQEYEFVVNKTGESTTIQYFCNRDNEPIYFPDRTLSALFQVNLSTLRGRFNRMTKKHEGYRLLISEKSKTRLSSLHFINWDTQSFIAPDGTRTSSPLHGLVALNHIILVNYALSDWIAYNHERLGTNLSEIEANLRKVNLSYSRNNHVITILQKRPHIPTSSSVTTTSSPSSFPPLLDYLSEAHNSHPIHHLRKASSAEEHTNLPTLTVPFTHSRKRSFDQHDVLGSSLFAFNPQPVATPTNPIVPFPLPQLRPLLMSDEQILERSTKIRRLSHSPTTSDAEDDSPRSTTSYTSSSEDTESPRENYVLCSLSDENITQKINISSVNGFLELRYILSNLFRVNTFKIFYQSLFDETTHEMPLDLLAQFSADKWDQFVSIAKHIIVQPITVTPKLENLLS
eukprot:TRINITY_DN8836_c0_g1_i1.p1 TRINITY_DN8836_c0_g1~~TRINITY_DN8836_c0_g1_i1.p1  ORF type:complete len:411 (+),score=66.33 TRINITY_DN8836_c0_g1_i1:120-1352(+)